MATILKVSKAFRAMKDIGIGEDRTEPVLKKLLKLYEKNWELIEKENYRVLADAIFYEGGNKEEDFGEDIQAPNESVRPLKRLRLRGQEAQVSPFQNSTVSGLNETPLIIPKLEEAGFPEAHPPQQLQLCASKGSENDPSSSRHAEKGKEPVSPNMVATVKKSNMEKPSTALHIKEPAVVSGVKNHKVRASGAHTLIVPKDDPFTDDINTTVLPPYELPIAAVHTGSLPKDEPFTDDISTTILPPYELSIAAIHPATIDTEQRKETEDEIIPEAFDDEISNQQPNNEEEDQKITPSKKKKKTTKRKEKLKGLRVTEKTNEGPVLIQPRETWMSDQKLNIFCKTKCLEILKMKMSVRQKQILKKSFVRNFLDLPTDKFPSQLLLQIIRRRVHHDDPKILRFNIEGVVIDFTIRDFCLITGMKCTPLKFVNIDRLPPSSIDKEILTNYGCPNLDHLIKQMKDYDFKDDNISVKIAKLIILESVILARPSGNRLDHFNLRIVEDRMEFESYPWGTVAYDILVKSVEESVRKQRSSSMNILGFTYALVFWGYEVIEKLTTNGMYGRRLRTTTPRMKNWDCRKISDYKKLEDDVFNDEIEVVAMEPTEEEMEMDYMEVFINDKGKTKINEVEESEEFEELLENEEVRFEKTDMGGTSSGGSKGYEEKDLKYDLEDIKLGLKCLDDKVNIMFDMLKVLIHNRKEQEEEVGTTQQEKNTNNSFREDEVVAEKNNESKGLTVEVKQVDGNQTDGVDNRMRLMLRRRMNQRG